MNRKRTLASNRPSTLELAGHLDEGFVHLSNPSEAALGCEVKAIHEGEVRYFGLVTDVHPDMPIIWIFDNHSLSRKLIEVDDFTLVVRSTHATCLASDPKEQL